MPTYEYVCEKCNHQFEVFQSMKDQPLAICPKERCPQQRWGKGKVRRQLGTGAGLIFKGSGFYITDYRSETYKAAAKKEAAPSSSGSSSSGSSSTASSAPASSSTPPAGGSSGGGAAKKT